MTKNILLVGVGGQGTITASKILTEGLLAAGYDVKMSEIHGMSQRGGSVSSQIRYGEEVFSPVIEKGQADMIVAFEKLEAMRYLDYLKSDGKLVVNDHEIKPVPMLSGDIPYPDNLLDDLEEKADVYVIDAIAEAEKLGNLKAMNIVLLGRLVKLMDLTHIEWESIIRHNIKEKFIDLNLKAFSVGLNM